MSVKNKSKKFFCFLGVTGLLLLVIFGLFHLSPFRFNLSGSMPIGLYMQLPNDWVDRGDFVAVCLPKSMAIEGKERGYLLSGQCPGGAKPILKEIIAVPGDRVLVSDSGIDISLISFIPSRFNIEEANSSIHVDVTYKNSNALISPRNASFQMAYQHFYFAPQLHEDHNHLIIHRWIQNGIYYPVQGVWLYGANDPVHSWDSRYYGEVPIKNIIGIYEKI